MDLSGRKLILIKMINVDLEGAQLRDCNFSLSKLQKVNLSASDMRNVEMHKASIEKTIMTNTNLTDSNLSATFFREVNIGQSVLDNADLFKCDWADVSMMNVSLQNVYAVRSEFCRCNMQQSNWENSNLLRAKMLYCDLRGANIAGVHFEQTSLRNSCSYGVEGSPAAVLEFRGDWMDISPGCDQSKKISLEEFIKTLV